MIKLLKEVFKSLSKNKITVIGLTILIFITCGLFTLLFDVRQSYTKTLQNFKTASKMQDLTVDLDVNPSGEVPNGGYNQVTENGKRTKKPTIYTPTDKFGRYSSKVKLLNVPSDSLNFVALKHFTNVSKPVSSDDNLYIDSGIFQSWFLESQKLTGPAKFDMEAGTVSFNKDTPLQIFKKHDGKFVSLSETKTINKTTSFSLMKAYKLSDIATVINEPKGSTSYKKDDYLIKPLDLFLNLDTHKASFNYSDFESWSKYTDVVIVSGSQVLKQLGFTKGANNRYYYTSRSSKDLSFKNNSKVTQTNIDASVGIISTFNLNNYLNEMGLSSLETKVYSTFVFKDSEIYSFPKSWIQNNETEVQFERRNFVLNWDKITQNNSSNWKGTYLSFISKVYKENHGQIPADMQSFSFWTKTTKKRSYLQTQKPSDWIEKSDKITLTDLDAKLISIDGKPLPGHNNTIAKIENFNSDWNYKKRYDKFVEISNTNALQEKRNVVSNGANNIAKNAIINHVIEKVGEDNVGLRQSLTVESINEEDTKKNTFHFINTGDANYSIRGVKQNVGKLHNEQNNPTLLNSVGTTKDIDDYLLVPDPKVPNRKTKLPTEYARTIIEYIFKGYTPDPAYLDTDIRFEPYYNYYKGTQIPYSTNGKIVALTSTNEDNNIVQYGITTSVQKSKNGEVRYIILGRQLISGKESWVKLLLSTESDTLSIKELSDFLAEHKLTIKAQIGKRGWAVVDRVYTNNISLPLLYGAVEDAAVIDITQHNSIGLLIQQIKEAILSTDLAQIITKPQLNRILLSAKLAVEKNSFHNLLAAGKTNDAILQAVMFDWLYNMTIPLSDSENKVINSNGNTFLQSVFNNIINFIKNKYKYTEEGQLRTLDQQRAYLKKEFDNVELFIKNATGSKDGLLESLITGISLGDLVYYIKDFDKLLDSLSEAFSSIDFIKFSTLAKDWYAKHPYKPYTNPTADYYILSSEEKTTFLFKSIDQNVLKDAIKKLLSTLDFAKFLDPASPKSLYSYVISAADKANKPLSNEQRSKLISLFKKFNAYPSDPAKAYSNINEGLNILIDSFSLPTFTMNLDHFLNRSIRKEAVNVNGVIYQNNYSKHISSQEYVTSLISAITQTKDSNGNFIPGKVKQIQDALVLLANLSHATTSAAGLNIPADDPHKLSLNDVGTFDLIRFPNSDTNDITKRVINQYDVDKINGLKNKVDNAINQGQSYIKFSIEESNFLKTTALVTNKEFSNLKEVQNKLDQYLNLVKKLNLNNYLPEDKTYNLTFSDDGSKPVLSYGDLAYRSALFNKNADVENKNVLRFLYNQIKPILSGFMAKNLNGVVGQELNLYGSWIQLAYDIKEQNPDISLEEIKQIIVAIYNFGTSSEVRDLLRQYNKVDQQIPSYGSLLGSDLDNYSSILKISYGLSNSIAAAKEFKDKDIVNKVKGFLGSSVSKYSSSVQKALKNNIYQVISTFSLINESNMMPSYYAQGQKEFINNFINASEDSKLGSLITSFYDLNVLYQHMLNSTKTAKIINILGINPGVLNPFIALSFPQILLYTAISDDSTKGNLSYLISRLSRELETIPLDELNTLVGPAFNKLIVADQETLSAGDKNINLDASYFSWLRSKIVKTDGVDQIIFDLNLKNIFDKIVSSTIANKSVNNIIAYNASSAYLAKVNYAYMNKNHKEVYQNEDIKKYLNDPFQMANFVGSLDNKYKIKINSVEYVIVGIDTTADYLYPVINEENLQVDTSKQALVYVNDKGFDRIRSAYPTFALKDYLLVQKGDFKAEELKSDFSKFIAYMAVNITPKVYLAGEVDPINPERSIRITLIQKIIKAIGNVQLFSLIILISLVTLSLYFIIRRYINVRNKVIGILRSQGYKATEISFAFSSFCWLSTFIGGVTGYIAGHFIQPAAFRIFSSYWTLPSGIIAFNWITLINTVIVPLVAMSLLIFIITMFSIRIKPIEQMSGLSDLNIGKFAQKISVLFRRLPIKSRFVAMLTLNNFWKLFSLFISFSITSLITMFSLSSLNVFQKSIQRTYQNRNYKFKLDMETPTTEGGPYVLYDKNNLNDLLYMPDDLSASSAGSKDKNQTDYNSPFYFKPGYSYNTDVTNKPFAPSVITKSSLDIVLDTAVEISPWDIVFASLPETEKARVIQIFRQVSNKMTLTQNLHYVDGTIDYSKEFDWDIHNVYATATPDPKSEKVSYFMFFKSPPSGVGVTNASSAGQFWFIEWDKFNEYYKKPALIKTDRVRILYRDFLLNAYKKIDQNDFFMSFGGVIWNNDTNEKYSYAKTTLNQQAMRLYGYKHDSKFVQLQNDKHENLSDLLYSEYPDADSLPDDLTNVILPLVINNVTAKKANIGIGSEVKLMVSNNVDRYVNKVLNIQQEPKIYTFKVVGINQTFINNELITTKDIVDRITGLDTLTIALKNARQPELDALLKADPQNAKDIIKRFNNRYEAFNGIFSNDNSPEQTINTVTTYSSSGYWGAVQTFNANTADDKALTDFFKKIFVGQSGSSPMFKYTVKSYNDSHNTNFDYIVKLKEFLGVTDDSYKTWGDSALTGSPLDPQVKKEMVNAVNKLYGIEGSIYGKDIVYGASHEVDSKDIEAGFIKEIAKTITDITITFIVISFIVSIIILVMITNSMVSANKESIATFSILGYTNKEKVYLFFFNYIPVILLASLLMIPITLVLIVSFNAFMMATSQMVLPLSLYYSTILLSMLVSLLVFSITSIFAWISLNKIKPIYLLKGK